MNAAGVYYIECIPAGRFYIGSSITSVRRRFNQHRHALRAGKSENSKLQRAWDKYGESAFVFAPLMLCLPERARALEQQAIDLLAPDFNIVQIVGAAEFRPQPGVELRAAAAQRAREMWAAGAFRQNGRTVRQRHLVRGEHLSAQEIADRYNINLRTVRGRARCGARGDQLIAPLHQRRVG